VIKQAIEAAKAAGTAYWKRYDAAYAILRPHYDEKYAEFRTKLAPGLRESTLQLLDRLIAVGKKDA